MNTKNTQKIVIETQEGAFYLKKQPIRWENRKPVVEITLTKSKAWALTTDFLTKDDIIREIHANPPANVIYAH